jgi:transcriptional regulator with XRE-family HTH domain
MAAISQNEREFFENLGERIAQLRTERQISRSQLGEALGVTRQAVNAYEAGQRRVSVSVLPVLASMLGVSVEALIGAQGVPRRRRLEPKLQRYLERIDVLPKRQQQQIFDALDAMITQRVVAAE